jgi:hypothetical protein
MIISALVNAAGIFPSVNRFLVTPAVRGETIKSFLSSPLFSEGTVEIYCRRGGENAERSQEKNDFISPPFHFLHFCGHLHLTMPPAINNQAQIGPQTRTDNPSYTENSKLKTEN